MLFAAIAAVLWVVTVLWANDMGTMPGTMGMSLPSFVLMWALMMSAMMLPSVAPMALLYARTVQSRRRIHLALFVGGYVVAWTLTGIVAYMLAWVAGRLTSDAAGAAHIGAVVVFAAVGIYQLTPLKFRCLEHCRTPLGHLLRYISYRGASRDVRAGFHHGIFCLGCCWALMVLMVAFGVMNVWAMIALAIVVATEKLWRHGERFARAAGYGSLALAVAVIFWPGIAPGLDPANVMELNMTGM